MCENSCNLTREQEMKRHAFNQTEIFMLEGRIGEKFKQQMWEAFMAVANDLGFKVVVTGGNFLTHEINTTEDDFKALQELSMQQWRIL
jgi:hypothetical protein